MRQDPWPRGSLGLVSCWDVSLDKLEKPSVSGQDCGGQMGGVGRWDDLLWQLSTLSQMVGSRDAVNTLLRQTEEISRGVGTASLNVP